MGSFVSFVKKSVSSFTDNVLGADPKKPTPAPQPAPAQEAAPPAPEQTQAGVGDEKGSEGIKNKKKNRAVAIRNVGGVQGQEVSAVGRRNKSTLFGN